MSPIALKENPTVDRVAIIGAGPCGLAAAKYIIGEKKFSKVEVYEQRATAGGVWNYSPTDHEDGFSVPRTKPTSKPDQAIYRPESPLAEFVSPVYDFLETNIPHTLMNFTDREFPQGTSLFPSHKIVLQYLQDYAEDLVHRISYQTQVLHVKKIQASGSACWQLELRDLTTKQQRTVDFDAVIVASGHYNDPFIPSIHGLKEFDQQHPGLISHSKFYRRPDQFVAKKVIVVGNSASGIDLSAQISSVSKLPVLISEKDRPSPVAAAAVTEDKPWAENVPEITEFLPQDRAVRFADGRVEAEVDTVVFCTGYHYSFPFLQGLQPSVTVPDGSHAAHLWEHMLYTADPTLAFLSVPQRIVPFPVAEAQSAVIARMWAGRLNVPSRAEMDAWVVRLLKSKGGGGKSIHNLASPLDVEYINRLYDLSAQAKSTVGLENAGNGRAPPRWGPDKAWVRERLPFIKLASRALGEDRHKVKTLGQLGFDYEEWKKEPEQGEKLL